MKGHRRGAPESAGRILRESIDDAEAGTQAALIVAYLQSEIARILGSADGDLPDPDRNLFDLNVDSLMLVEVTAKLRQELRHPVRVSAFIEHPTITKLANHLCEIMGCDVSAEEGRKGHACKRGSLYSLQE
jgi:phthiocerol/phenolphthiocerol synthesis type-I polyketide synthase E